MLALFLAVMAAAWLVEAADDVASYNTFGSVVIVRSGERTPLFDPDTPRLTALGAQQMYQLGQNFRSRYLVDTAEPTGLGVQNILGMSPDLLTNDQLFIQTLDRPHLVSSAQAFMQGLYPPYTLNSTRVGPYADSTGILANNTVVDFPLGGYQYPTIQAVGELDPQSVYIAGAMNCPTSQLQSALYETTDEFLETQTATRSLYQSLDVAWFENNIPQSSLDYRYAFEIFDYLSYAYMHNGDAYEKLQNDSTYAGVYDRLKVLADQDAYYRWGNTSSSTTDSDDRAMAGKTLSALILGQFQKVVENGGNTTNGVAAPLSLLFTEQEAFISLASIMMIDYYSKNFQAVPPFGSAMVFELFTIGADNTFPDNHEDLNIRFYFHNGTEGYDGTLRAHSIFGNGPSRMDMTWTEFQDMMSRIMVNQLSDWCDKCGSGSLFCWGVDNPEINIILAGASKHPKLSNAVAGVIGAVVTLFVAGLLFAIAMLLGGIRFHRVARGKKSELGGFKGSAKLASDADLNLPRNGAAPAGIVSLGKGHGDKKTGHERVGSWELRQKEFGKDVADESRRGSFEAIEAAMSRPVEPTERV